MKQQYLIFTLFFLLNVSFSFAQSAHNLIMDGNEAYKNKNFIEAEELFRKALEKEYSGKAVYNLGNAIYSQGRYEEAIPKFVDAGNLAPNAAAKSSSYHNLGNSYFQNGQIEEAVEAYKDALRIKSSDIDTKYNLSRAQQLLKQQQQQQEEQEKQDQEDQENEEENENEENQENNKNEDEQEEQNQDQQQNQDPQNQENQDQQQAGEPQEMSRQEAMKLLEIMEQEEQNVQKKMQLKNATPNKSDKDW